MVLVNSCDVYLNHHLRKNNQIYSIEKLKANERYFLYIVEK